MLSRALKVTSWNIWISIIFCFSAWSLAQPIVTVEKVWTGGVWIKYTDSEFINWFLYSFDTHAQWAPQNQYQPPQMLLQQHVLRVVHKILLPYLNCVKTIISFLSKLFEFNIKKITRKTIKCSLTDIFIICFGESSLCLLNIIFILWVVGINLNILFWNSCFFIHYHSAD